MWIDKDILLTFVVALLAFTLWNDPIPKSYTFRYVVYIVGSILFWIMVIHVVKRYGGL